MAVLHFPNIKINDATAEQDILGLMKNIKFSNDDIKIQPILGGYSGKIYQCYQQNDPQNAVIIRIQNLERGLEFRQSELKMVQKLSICGHFPKIHAIFSNGYCYDYIHGEPIYKDNSDRMSEKMLMCVAAELAHIHSIKLEDMSYKKSTYLDIIEEEVNDRCFVVNGTSFTKSSMINEIRVLKKFLEKKQTRVVQCHGDLHPGNFIWNEETGKVTIIDWEDTHEGYQLQDLGHCFITMSRLGYQKPQHFTENFEQMLPSDYKRKFIRKYLEVWYDANKIKKDITDEDVDKWLAESEIFGMETLINYIIYALISPCKVEHFSGDENKFREVMVNEYLRLKEKNLGRGTFESDS